MADALIAPSKPKRVTIAGQELIEGSNEHVFLSASQEYDTGYNYMFELAEKSIQRELPVADGRNGRFEPHKEFKPFQNLVFTSQIVWNGSRTVIRYYDGCDSIFVSQQPKEKELIDQFSAQTNRRNFLDGKLGVWGYEKNLLLYMQICSWNVESPFRTQAASNIFRPVDKAKKATATLDKLEKMEEALKLSKEAPEKKMLIHAGYLGVPEMDIDSGNPNKPEEIRALYREYALNNPAQFLKSYGDTSIELKYYIDKALMEGLIRNDINPNKATWGKANKEICDISGLKSKDAIADKILEFSQLDAGKEFAIQLKALFS